MKPVQKTLLILTPGFPADENDTACLPAQQQFILSLQSDFPEMGILILALKYPFAFTNYSWHGIRVMSFGIRKGFYWKMNWLKVWKTLNNLNKNIRISGILCFWYTECGILGTLFGRLYGIKHYTWILGQDARRKNLCTRLVRPRPGELIAISDFLAAEFYKNHSIRPVQIIPNGIDARIFPAAIGSREIDVIGAGSLIPLKHYELFIEIIISLSHNFPSLKAILCGHGPESQRLKGMIETAGDQLNITLAGELPHPEVLSLMQRSKIFLHPSAYEGFSTACLEALGAGMHVISFCKPMIQDIPHWHVVRSKEEMKEKALFLLKQQSPDHEPVNVFSVHDASRRIMKLFGQELFANKGEPLRNALKR